MVSSLITTEAWVVLLHNTNPVFQCYYSCKYHVTVACDKMLETCNLAMKQEIFKSLIALLQQENYVCNNVLENCSHEIYTAILLFTVLLNCFQIDLHNFQNNSQVFSLAHILRRDIKWFGPEIHCDVLINAGQNEEDAWWRKPRTGLDDANTEHVL